jgi:CRP-like cAMP-binding protein
MSGVTIVRAGEPGSSFFMILEGEAKVVSPTGRTLNRLLPGDFFGEISLLDGGPRTASVITETPMTLLALSRTDFQAALAEEPAVAVKLLQHSAGMLRRMSRVPAG